MNIPIIAVANRKGGVGKTTIAAHLAAGLALRGFNVALVDTDAQGHGAEILGMPIPDWSDPNDYALYHLLTNRSLKLSHVVRLVPAEQYVPEGEHTQGTLRLIPSNEHNAVIPTSQVPVGRFRARLHDLIDKAQLDCVIIDTAPTHSMFDSSIMMAATHYLYVTLAAHLSMRGLRGALEELEQINEDTTGMREPIGLLGIVPNMVDARTINHRENLKMLNDHFAGVLTTPIMERTVIESATSAGRLVYSTAPYGPEHNMFNELVEQLIDRLANEAQQEAAHG